MDANATRDSRVPVRSKDRLGGRAAMMKPANWIRHHQVAAFFLITFAITWGLGFSFDAVMNEASLLLAPLVFVALCGPALAGIAVTGDPDQAGAPQSLLDRFLRGVGRVNARVRRQQRLHQPGPIIPRLGRLHPCLGGVPRAGTEMKTWDA